MRRDETIFLFVRETKCQSSREESDENGVKRGRVRLDGKFSRNVEDNYIIGGGNAENDVAERSKKTTLPDWFADYMRGLHSCLTNFGGIKRICSSF